MLTAAAAFSAPAAGASAHSGARGVPFVHPVQRPAHAPRAKVVVHKRALHAARATASKLAAAPALIAAGAPVAHTYVVDTANDTNVPSGCAVGNSATCSLRAAVTAANADTGVDQVTVPAGLNITLTSGVITLDNSMIIAGAGATVNGGDTQIFTEDNATVAVHITGLTMTGGSATDGGAIYLGSGSLVLSAVYVVANAATNGGGVYDDNGSLWIDHSVFSTNDAASGGAVYLNGGAQQFVADTFGGSSASAGNIAADGAGIYNSNGDAVISGCTISYNTSGVATYGYGVGIYNDEVMDLTASTINNNTATAGGEGAGLVNYYDLNATNLVVDNNSITGAGEADGTGIYSSGDITSLTDVVVAGSSSAVSNFNILGGAVYANDYKFTWYGGTISDTSNGALPTYNDFIQGGALYTDADNTIVSGVTISGTTNQAGTSGVEGGAIYNDYYSTFQSMAVSTTTSTGAYVYGGAIESEYYADLSVVQISLTTTHGSSTSGGYVYGGVIYNDDYMTMTDVTSNVANVTADLATDTTPSATQSYIYGGDFINYDSLTANGLSFTNSTVTAAGGSGYIYGGGIYNDDLATLNNAQVVGSTVSAAQYVDGGLLYNDSLFTAANLTLGNATVSVPGSADQTNPSASGSILDSQDAMTVVNGTISNVTTSVATTGNFNAAVEVNTLLSGPKQAGAVRNVISVPVNQLTNTTIANDAVSGPSGSTFLVAVAPGDSLSLLNTIVASTTPTLNCFGVPGSIVSVGNNLDNGATCGFTHPGDLQNTNPAVAALAANGGLVETAALLPGSPAIDAGTNSGCPSTDARGTLRPQGTSCDIGSYESLPVTPPPPVIPRLGYWLDASDGGIFTFGPGATFHGSLGSEHLNAPIVGMAADSATGGYWLVASDGGIFSFDAPFLGSEGSTHLSTTIVGMTAAAGGTGYWLVGADGEVFNFGPGAAAHGSLAGAHLNAPIVGMAADAATGGYWLVGSDGGVYSFDAPFLGSEGGVALNKPIVGMAAAPGGAGYWLVASDGGVFSFGAHFYGSAGSIPLNKPVVGMAADPVTGGYWLVASDGGIFSYNAPFYGSEGGKHLNMPIVGMASA